MITSPPNHSKNPSPAPNTQVPSSLTPTKDFSSSPTILHKLIKLEVTQWNDRLYASRIGSEGRVERSRKFEGESSTQKQNDSSYLQRDSGIVGKKLQRTALHRESKEEHLEGPSVFREELKEQGGRLSKSRPLRFSQITVYEHLYNKGRKQYTRRAIEQVLCREYEKENIFTFTPQINPNSQSLARKKINDRANRQNLESKLTDLESQLSKAEERVKANGKTTQRHPSVNDRQIVQGLFSALSAGREVLDLQTINMNSVPFGCLKQMKPLLEGIYQGRKYTFLQFASAVNDKHLVPCKKLLIELTSCWLGKLGTRKESLKKD